MRPNGVLGKVSVVMVASLVAACSSVAAPPSSQSVLVTPSPSPASAAPATPPASVPPTPIPSPSAEILPDDLDPDLVQAIRLRQGYGLRYDLAYVQMVAEDPAASNRGYGVPLYPAEFEDAQSRYEASRAVAQIVNGYASAHPDEFGGLYIDEATHTGVVSLWTDHLAEHAAAIRVATGPDARIAFGQVRYPEADLRELQDQIDVDWRAAWLTEIPAAFESVGVDIKTNQLFIEVSSANPEAEAIIESHYGLGDRLRVDSDGTGVELIPAGTIKGRVTPVDALRGLEVELDWVSDDLGHCGGGDVGYGVDRHGRFTIGCQIGTWTIIVMALGNHDERRELGRGTVKVEADKTVTLTIRLDP